MSLFYVCVWFVFIGAAFFMTNKEILYNLYR